MDISVDEVGKEAAVVLTEVATWIQPLYPHHAEALFGEIVDTTLTNERWNRVSAVLSSMSAIPGSFLVGEEHDLRNLALSAVLLSQKMASATFGGNGALDAATFARWLTARISGMMIR